MREKEIALREREVPSRRSNPLVVAIFAASVGLFANVVVAYLNNQNTLRVEQERAQSSLILEAIKTGNPDTVCKNLVFFVSLGLIDDASQTIRNQCKSSPKGIPSLPPSPAVSGTGYGVQPFGVGPYGGGSIVGSGRQAWVVDARTARAVQGAKVTIGQTLVVQTNESGTFQIPWELDQADITIEKQGYETIHENLKEIVLPYFSLVPTK